MFLIESESQLCLPCQNIIINPLLCMSRKNNNTGLNLQCTKKKKFGDYCGIHSKSFKILRIDELLNYKDLKTSKPRKQSIYPEFKKLKLNELKALCKENNLQIFGKKKDIIQQLEYYYELKKRFHNSDNVIIKCQSIFRGNLIRKINKLRGPGYINKSINNNEDDFYSMLSKHEIDNLYFFSYTDIDNFVYCFDIRSFIKLLQNLPINPYNRNEIPSEVKHDFNNLIKLLELNGNLIDDYEKPKLNKDQDFKQRVLTVFCIFDELDFYTDFNWFLNLNINQLKHFYKAAEDIWSYRANINHDIKKKIRPDSNEFKIKVQKLYQIHNFNKLQEIILEEIKNFITLGITRDDRVLGAMYMLTALTEVSYQCASAMPWLLQLP